MSQNRCSTAIWSANQRNDFVRVCIVDIAISLPVRLASLDTPGGTQYFSNSLSPKWRKGSIATTHNFFERVVQVRKSETWIFCLVMKPFSMAAAPVIMVTKGVVCCRNICRSGIRPQCEQHCPPHLSFSRWTCRNCYERPVLV